MNTNILVGRDLFPVDEIQQQELQKRAANYKNVQWEKLEVEKKESYVKFKLNETSEFGIIFSHIHTVLDTLKLEKPPCSTSLACGVINQKGHLIPVIDIRPILGIPADNKFISNQVIVIEDNHLMAGLAVHSIEGDDGYLESELFSPHFMGETPAVSFSIGMHNGTVPIIDVKQLLTEIVKINEDK
jgi:chemotaxis signal transduction protein